MTKSEITIRKAIIDNRIRAIVTAMSKLKDLEYATEQLTLSIMLAEQEDKLKELNHMERGYYLFPDSEGK